jgi:hypothetical protein
MPMRWQHDSSFERFPVYDITQASSRVELPHRVRLVLGKITHPLGEDRLS